MILVSKQQQSIILIKRYQYIKKVFYCFKLIKKAIEKITQKYEVWMIKELLSKFGIHKTFEELPDLIDMAREQNSIESFEKTSTINS